MTIQNFAIRMFGGLALAAGVGLQAQTITLNFNSRPTAQGWKYDTGPSATPLTDDKVVFTTNGVMLHQDTIQANTPNAHLFQPGGGGNLYRLPNVVARDHPFTITVLVAIRQYEGTLGCGFSFGADTGTETYGVCLTKDTKDPNTPNTIWLQGSATNNGAMKFDNSEFNLYQLEVTPGTGSKLYRNGVLVNQTGQNKTTQPAPNGLSLGDGTGGANAVADVKLFTYSPFAMPCSQPAGSTR
jgi:hypothetical protein